jgi:hypothetical protein
LFSYQVVKTYVIPPPQENDAAADASLDISLLVRNEMNSRESSSAGALAGAGDHQDISIMTEGNVLAKEAVSQDPSQHQPAEEDQTRQDSITVSSPPEPVEEPSEAQTIRIELENPSDVDISLQAAACHDVSCDDISLAIPNSSADVSLLVRKFLGVKDEEPAAEESVALPAAEATVEISGIHVLADQTELAGDCRGERVFDDASSGSSSHYLPVKELQSSDSEDDDDDGNRSTASR